jgi:glycosyltransferase involved in cell wall biosynthesis
MSKSRCAVVIATYQRPGPLRRALESLRAQTLKPERVIVVDASIDHDSETVAAGFIGDFQMTYLRSQTPSSARQRNAGLEYCDLPLVLFMDDDSTLRPPTLERLASVFETYEAKGEAIGGVGARMEGFSHRKPGPLLWLYYRWQSGYYDATYGGKLFGPGINCLACYEGWEEEDLIPSQWLPTGCVLYRTECVKRELFPEFDGYSFMEDVHLSARIARTHPLFFHTRAMYRHEDAPSPFKVFRRELARHRLLNQRVVAEQVMGQSGFLFEFKFWVHRLFASVSVLRGHGKDWVQELIGIWT